MTWITLLLSLEKPTAIPRPQVLETLLQGLPVQAGTAVRGLFDGLTGELKSSQATLERSQARVRELELEIRLREEQLRLALIGKYGPKGEKLNPVQIQLLDLEPGVQLAEVEQEAARSDAEKAATTPAPGDPAARRRKARKPYGKVHPGRSPLPAHLPRQEVILICEEAPRGVLIGYEIKEELVIKPAEFYVQVIKREKRLVAVAGKRTIITAPMLPRVIEKSQFGDSVIIELLVRKYCDHLPAYRQRHIWERDHGLIVNDAQLIRSILKTGELLQPLARAIGVELKKGPLIQADETRVPVLQQEGKGRNDTAWMWQYSAPGGLIYFDYQDSRSRDGPKNFLAGYQGTLQSDGYEVYTKLGQEVHAHAGCWAHARRKFDNARKAAPKEVPCRDSQGILDQIAVLYQIEQEARSAGLDAAARLHHRNQRGLSAKLDALKQSILSIRSRVLPASQLGKACDYTLGQWEKLIVYARDGVVEIDNNWCENGMRPIALGRKNWMHLGSQESGPKVAAIMTVIASAQQCGHNVRDYLAAVLPRLATLKLTTESLTPLLPNHWQPAAPAAPGIAVACPGTIEVPAHG